jgi:hypothetical protein
MNTFTFYQKNSSAILTITSNSFEDAEKELKETVDSSYGWRCDNEDGE